MVAVAFYMVVELGSGPYDAIPQIISKYVKKIPYAVIRMIYDLSRDCHRLAAGQHGRGGVDCYGLLPRPDYRGNSEEIPPMVCVISRR